jgi:uncharacterized protein (DUF1800 family)
MKRMAAERHETNEDAKAALNVLRDAYLPHYRAQVLARAQSATLTTRPFSERLVHFWANDFAVSADKVPSSDWPALSRTRRSGRTSRGLPQRLQSRTRGSHPH